MLESRWSIRFAIVVLPALPSMSGGAFAGSPADVAREGVSAAADREPEVLAVLSSAVHPNGIENEAAYLAYIDARGARMATAAEQAATAPAEIEHRLAAANWILARETEPRISRLLLGIERPEDVASLTALLVEARSQLERCPALLDKLESAGKPSADEHADAEDADQVSRVEDLRRVYRDLSAFAGALATIWSPDAGEDVDEQIRSSASALSVLLEDDRPGVAAAAGLYQALLYKRAGRLDRALAVLDLVLKPLKPGDEPMVFLTRLLRCRCLAQRGDYVATWSLLLRLEERAREWFEKEASRAGEEAARAALLARLDVAAAWRAQLLAEDKSERAAWCEQSSKQIRDALREEDRPPQVMRAGSAIPLLLEQYDFAEQEIPD